VSALVASALVLAGSLVVAAASASAASVTKVGAWSRDWVWFDRAVGAVDVYRGYDSGFNYPTWRDVPRFLRTPGG